MTNHQSKYSCLQSRDDPHHFFSVSGGQGLPPRRACVSTLRVRVDSPMLHVVEHSDHSPHSPTTQCRVPPYGGGYGPFSIAWPSCPCFVRSFLFLFSKKKPFHAKTLVFLHNVSLESNRLIKVCVCVCVCENGALRHGGQRPDKNLPSICFLLDFVFGSAITNDIHHGGVILHFDQGIGIQV